MPYIVGSGVQILTARHLNAVACSSEYHFLSPSFKNPYQFSFNAFIHCIAVHHKLHPHKLHHKYRSASRTMIAPRRHARMQHGVKVAVRSPRFFGAALPFAAHLQFLRNRHRFPAASAEYNPTTDWSLQAAILSGQPERGRFFLFHFFVMIGPSSHRRRRHTMPNVELKHLEEVKEDAFEIRRRV